MAAVQLCFLLFALISNIHAEEHFIEKESDSLTFNLTEEADFCLISRFVDEEKLVLWNTSDLWTKNSTVPEDLKQRLLFVNGTDFSSLMIHNLSHSDSGRYQKECWNEGKVTYEQNVSITVCSTIYEDNVIYVRVGGEVDLPCEAVSDNLDIMWIKSEYRYKTETLREGFWDSSILAMDNVKNTSVLHVSNFSLTVSTFYDCLVMNQQQCVNSYSVQLFHVKEILYHLVDESAELQCTVTDFSNEQLPFWTKFNPNSYTELGRNYSLSFPSLTLNHSGWYFCKTSESTQMFLLAVCPTFDLPVVELVSEGDEVTLRCRDVREDTLHFWFIKSIQTGGRTVGVIPGKSKLNLNGVTIHLNASLVISDASLTHSGEYWCAVIHMSDDQCVSTSKTLVMYREPFGIHSTFYKGRWSLLSGLLVVLCAVVVAVTWRTRTRREEET